MLLNLALKIPKLANVMLSGERLNSFPLRSGTKTMMSVLALLSHTGCYSQCNKQENKKSPILKGNSKTLHFADNMTLHIDL